MLIRDIIDETYQDFKDPSMLIAAVACTWKCCLDAGAEITLCQNSSIATQEIVDVPADEIFRRYSTNPLTKAVVIGGLEPMLQIDDVMDVIGVFRRNGCLDPFVIYTGYDKEEVLPEIEKLKVHSNVIVKFGRYIPNSIPRHDPMLGISLSSTNQYAERIS